MTGGIYLLNDPAERLRLVLSAPSRERRIGMVEFIRRHCGEAAMHEVITRLREHRPS